MTRLQHAELATGMVLGAGAGPRLPRVNPRLAPPAALESAIVPSLASGPCFVSFSGGRDSSAVLAAATAAARRQGLPDPVPVTNRFRAAGGTDESRWQETVVRHLGLADWVRLELGDELDVVGPYARRVLRRHGLLWPFNAHFHLPLLELAAGGTLLTGVGGDELFAAATASRVESVLARRTPPVAGDARRFARAGAPRFARRLVRRARLDLPWLSAEGRRAAGRMIAAHDAAEPTRLGARLRWCRRLRYLQVGTESLDLLAAEAGARIAHPLLDATLWGAVARAAAPWGTRGRADGLRLVVGDLLPGEVLARRDKACFDAAFFTGTSRAFALGCDLDLAGGPAGLDLAGGFVDAAALRSHWAEDAPLAQSYLLLQAAWLRSAGGQLAQQRRDGGHLAPVARPA